MGRKRKRKIHLAQFLVHAPTFHSLAMWRHPRTDHAHFAWNRPELYQHIARVCERGRFDMLFFADLNYISDAYRASMEPALRYAVQAPEHDPIPLLSYMGAVSGARSRPRALQNPVRPAADRGRDRGGGARAAGGAQ